MVSMAASRRGRLVAALALALLLLGGFVRGPGFTSLAGLLSGGDGDERWLSIPDGAQTAKIEHAAQPRPERPAIVHAPAPPAALAQALAQRPEAIFSPAPAPPNIQPPAAGPEHGRPSPTGPPDLG